MNIEQCTIFDYLYPKYKVNKPIRLIELFAGYGSQYLALKYLNANVKHYKICEWAIKSIQAYNDLHIQDYFDYSGDLSDDNVLDILIKLGVSINYNEPATRVQLKRQNFRKVFNNIIATNNLVNIQNAKGVDFKIIDKDQYEYIMTYSFPCQDLSLAGKRNGMADTSTRSGMLWEVERILNELNELDELPQVLLMENVPQVHGNDNVEHFNKWQLALEKLGYKNYFQDLIATDYGVPQTRNRCFMLSILGNYSYSFPKPIPLELKLKDMLEDEVDEKYYLSDKQINDIQKWNTYEKPLEQIGRDTVTTLTTRSGAYCSNMKLVPIPIKNYENYIEWEDGKNLQMNNLAYKLDKCMGTLNTSSERKVLENKVSTIGNYSKSQHSASRIVDKEHMAPTFTENHETITAIQTNNLRIRKLTPLECFRLMGVKDNDYYKISKNQSNNSLYHLAGDSIVVNVLMAIFKELLL